MTEVPKRGYYTRRRQSFGPTTTGQEWTETRVDGTIYSYQDDIDYD